ncbi:MAG: hypothetical protein HOD63_02805 [Bacteroidetes bacterium]|jgi:hypothetical protein|nr:hypothetical protein [Bacteroidota bacterium]MBT5528336.1 hypothetical protein [Cytophagia bacterium]MBT3421640.1 hypothetical protein [Bacteroidota bacterium]MBT3933082.1 hypothetical protein [Bacteroidota bacterium]MBT4337498.1 hypothetical protein [Bacteroidota bacterium]
MKQEKQNRKAFFKQLGLVAGGAITSSFTTDSKKTISFSEFTQEQKDFLKEYALWLDDFNGFVETQKTDVNNLANNKKLMELAEQAERNRIELEGYMKNERFAIYYQTISMKVKKAI